MLPAWVEREDMRVKGDKGGGGVEIKENPISASWTYSQALTLSAPAGTMAIGFEFTVAQNSAVFNNTQGGEYGTSIYQNGSLKTLKITRSENTLQVPAWSSASGSWTISGKIYYIDYLEV